MLKSKNGLNMTDTLAGWEIVKRGNFDMGDYLEGYNDPDKKLPTDLLIRIALPGVDDPSTINAEVHIRSVHIKAGIHNFSIPLPYEVIVNDDYSAKWKAPLLTLDIKVKQEKKIRRPFLLHQEEEEENDKGLEQISEPQQEVPSNVVYEAFKDPETDEKPKIQTIQKMQFHMTTEDKVVTIVLYVPRADENTLVIDDNFISIETKSGQLYQAEIKPPFPLKSDPIIKSNPVSTTLIFIEKDESEVHSQESQENAPHQPEIDLSNGIPPLKNVYIYELEP